MAACTGCNVTSLMTTVWLKSRWLDGAVPWRAHTKKKLRSSYFDKGTYHICFYRFSVGSFYGLSRLPVLLLMSTYIILMIIF